MTVVRMGMFNVLVFLITGTLDGEDVRRLQLGTFAYDLAVLVPRDEFREDLVLSKLKNFAEQQQSRHKLSRMTIAFRKPDLSYAVPTEVPYVPGNYGRDWSSRQFVAQVWCMNGKASALLKFGEDVKYFQLLGGADPRVIQLGERSVGLVSFRIDGGTRTDQIYSLESPTGAEVVTFYAVARPLLTLPEAERLLTVLRSSLNSQRVDVIVRPDAIFGPNGGPVLDVFHPPFPGLSKVTYMATSYVVCSPDRGFSSKKGRVTESTCRITKPSP